MTVSHVIRTTCVHPLDCLLALSNCAQPVMCAWEEQFIPLIEMESPLDSAVLVNTATWQSMEIQRLTVQLAHIRSWKVKLHVLTVHLASCAMEKEPLTQSHVQEVDTVMVVVLPKTVLQALTTKICTPSPWSIAMIVLQEPIAKDPHLTQ